MLLLQAIDQRWKEHLQRIDQLREWINLRAYAQKDPLVEYKQEAFKMFEEMNHTVKTDALEKLFKIQLVLQNPAEMQGFEDAGGAPGEMNDDELEASYQEAREAAEAEAEDALEALRPKRQRMVFSSGDTEPDPHGGGGSRAQRRRLERDSKKKRRF
jgi:preprotein translocase subunit SecA